MVKRHLFDGALIDPSAAGMSRHPGPKECTLFMVRSTIVAAALATVVMGAGAAGAAHQVERVAYTTATATQITAPPPGHKFRAKFRTLQDCQRQAQHDHPGRAGDWDCRQGPDRNNPWEYWGI
jgi:hypothetical protein